MGCQTLRARGLFPLVSDTRRRLFLPYEILMASGDATGCLTPRERLVDLPGRLMGCQTLRARGLFPLERYAPDAGGAELRERTAARHGRAAIGTAGVLHFLKVR
jgi:hypothetical protein